MIDIRIMKLVMMPTKKKAKLKSKVTAQEKGANLEKRTESWMKRKFEINDSKRNILARGKIVKRPYEIDVLGKKGRLGGLLGTDYFAFECKALRVKRLHVTKFRDTINDIKKANEDGIESWCPTYSFIVSNEGFDSDAVEMAKDKNIGLILAADTGFKFVVRPEEE